jgi:hypothetical protein
MANDSALKANPTLIKTLGDAKAHLAWAMALYLEEPDIEALASEALTDGPDDKKIDFIYLDRDAKRIVLAQGYYGKAKKDPAPSNQAADLNTACAWLLSGSTTQIPEQLQPAIEECRSALKDGEVDAIDLLYVHNFPESVNVARELQTVAHHLRNTLGGYLQELCLENSQAAGFSLTPSVKIVPLMTSASSGEPFNDRQPFDAASISLKTIARHADLAMYIKPFDQDGPGLQGPIQFEVSRRALILRSRPRTGPTPSRLAGGNSERIEGALQVRVDFEELVDPRPPQKRVDVGRDAADLVGARG